MNVNNDFDERLDFIISLMPGLVYFKDIEGIYLSCNDLFASYAGFTSRKEMIGKRDTDLPWKEQADVIKRNHLEIITSGLDFTIEEVITLFDDSKAILLSNKKALRDQQGNIIGVLCTASDISKRKQREGELQDIKDKAEIALENILNNVPAHIFWKDQNCILLGCNDLQAKNMGFLNGKEMIGKNNYDVIWPNQSEEERKAQAEAITKLDLEVMRTGEIYTAEEPLVLPDGSTAIYLSKKSPLRNEKGEIVGLLGISFDITEKKGTEQELIETKNKLEGMTLISATIAHEMRTPLSAFNIATNNIKVIFPQLKQGYLWAKEKGASIEDIDHFYLDFVEKKLNAMEKEIQSASTFIDIALMNTNPKLDMGYPKILSISDVIDEALSRYPFSGKRDLVKWQRDANTDFRIKSDTLLIVHVLFNLIKNALYYVAKAGGSGDIKIWLELGSPYNKLYFKDTGTGIATDVLPRIFDQFFSTTDYSAHPAGVGLTFCKKVMESLKGGIVCESIQGEYTLFILSFPGNI